jgi:HSP20 family protein
VITPQPIRIRIKDLRREHSLTQEELAEALGLSRQSVNAMEAGRCLPSLPVAMQISAFFSAPIHNIFELDGELQEKLEIATRKQVSNVSSQEETMNHLVPFSPLREMREMLDGLMDETASWAAPVALTAPAVNISQTSTDVHVEMRLPGFKREDLTIEVGEDFISISGEKKQEAQGEDKQYFRREFAESTFNRTLSLPALVQVNEAHAEVKYGILHVKLPKIKEEKLKTTKLEIGGE